MPARRPRDSFWDEATRSTFLMGSAAKRHHLPLKTCLLQVVSRRHHPIKANGRSVGQEVRRVRLKANSLPSGPSFVIDLSLIGVD